MKFRKRPVEIEAFQWVGFNENFLKEWTDGRFRVITIQEQLEVLKQNVEAGREHVDMTAEVYDEIHDTWVKMKLTDWVVKGVQGEFYPCDNDVLEATYDYISEPDGSAPIWGTKKSNRTPFDFGFDTSANAFIEKHKDK